MHQTNLPLRALYVDFNAYFASVEQQLVPALRGKPVGVVPVVAETTCCIAASYEAKALGIKTGTSVRDARALCPDIILVQARPPVYVEYHHKLVQMVEDCTHVEQVLSIDEMVCKLTGSQQHPVNALALAARIKQTLRERAGAYLRCSIGIAPNTFLSKLASNMQKPDGCTLLQADEIPARLLGLQLRDLNGIGHNMEARLQRFGIRSVADLYAANRRQLHTAWGSIEGERMYDKLRGIDLPLHSHDRSSLGHSHVLPPELRSHAGALAVLHRLLQKASLRLRSHALLTEGLRIKVKFAKGGRWSSECNVTATDDTLLLTAALETLWQQYPARNGTPLAVGVLFTRLIAPQQAALDIFNPTHQRPLNRVMDQLNLRYGKHTVYLGGAHQALHDAPMRIAFTHIPDLHTEAD